MVTETEFVPIDDQLRLVLFGLECAFDVEFSVAVVEKIFSDSEEDAVSEKRYAFWAGPHLKVTGYVKDYEPGEIYLTVKTAKAVSPTLETVIEHAKYQVYRLRKQHDR